MKKGRSFGFSFVEIIVVVAIISVLSTIAMYGLSETRAKSRDAQRQADLRILQGAVERYKMRHGKYPEGCNGPNAWSAQAVDASSPHKCAAGTQYIVGLAPEFISVLPVDRKPNGSNSGYMYYSNAGEGGVNDGTAYKLIAYNTVESEAVATRIKFEACDRSDVCTDIAFSGGESACVSDAAFATYAMWGGYPQEAAAGTDEQQEEVICRMP
jgi:prepilin-type N-terminal cleavage/methylation domain-containing protein